MSTALLLIMTFPPVHLQTNKSPVLSYELYVISSKEPVQPAMLEVEPAQASSGRAPSQAPAAAVAEVESSPAGKQGVNLLAFWGRA